ncbi:MAG: hypothetical protein U9R16_04270 [Campylobacterota bacterium]|nr:hypothetical protein [Campylobacterota bacterium]
MGLKKYIFGSLLLILAVFGYVFSIESGDYRVEIVDSVVVLPIAIWVVAPIVVLFIMSVLHILFYGLKNYFAIKAVSKDIETLTNLIGKKLLKQDSVVSFKNKEFEELSKILNQLDIDLKGKEFSSTNKTIEKIVSQLSSIENGKYITSKELKLSNDNPLMIKNLKNRVSEDDNFALEAIKKSSNYSLDIVKLAFDKVLKTKSITTIKKNLEEVDFDKDMLIALFKKDSEQKNEFAMTNDMILNLIKKVELTNEDLIEIAKNYKLSMSPDQLIKLYEDISVINEDYTSAYLYVLAQYEMIDKMRDILVNSSTNEFISYKAIIDLKDAGKNTYSLDTLCYK